MATLDIPLPEDLKPLAESQATQGGYTTVSEYIRALILADAAVDADTEAELLKGLASPAREVTAADWAEKRRRFEQRHSGNKQ